MTSMMSRAAVAALAIALGTTTVPSGAEAQTTMRVSHQWSTADVRHQVVEIIKEEVEKADVGLELQIFPSGSLFKAREQYKPLARGQLEATVFPLSYAGGLRSAYNLTLMPGLVKNHDHAARLNESDFMGEIENIMAEDDVMVLVHGYLAGGFAGVDKCITNPNDVEGLQSRAAGKAFEQMLAGAGASIASMSSSEIYNAMQTGVLDAANTSSASFMSFRIYEQVSCFTPAGDFALWFMYQPMLVNKSFFDGLTPEQQEALKAGAAKAEAFYLERAKTQDAEAARVFQEAGVEIAEMSEEDFNAWRAIAQDTSYKAFLEGNAEGQRLLDLALSVE
ncbi:MAG: TRAP transporter substrate-binding protein DctP [Pseudomonadota bacterium]